MLEDVDLDATQLGDLVRLAAMVGQGMPTTGGARHLDGPVDPVHGKGDAPVRIGPESKFGQLEEVPDLGREGELRVFAEGFLDLRLLGIEPELLMAQLGFRTVAEMVGRVDMLDRRQAIDHWKAKGLDLSRLLYYQPPLSDDEPCYCCEEQQHGLAGALDHQLIALSQGALEHQEPVTIDLPIRNSDRTVGAMLSGKIAKAYGEDGLPDDTININLTGSAGQSFGAFLVRGINVQLTGDTNHYTGKGMPGGRHAVCPQPEPTFLP